MEPEREGPSVEQVLGVLRRRVLWVLLCFVVVAGAAYGFSKHQTKKYTATASLTFGNDTLSQQIVGLSAGNNSSLLTEQESDLELVKLGDMAAKTAQILGHGLTPEKVSTSVSVSGHGESSIVSVAATTTSPVLAAVIANTYTEQFVKEQRKTNREFFKSALVLVRKQLSELSPLQRVGSDGLDLQDRAHTLSLAAELGYNDAQTAQEAGVPSSPSSPRTKRNTILGAILGLLLGFGVAFLLERLDRRIRRVEDLEAIYGLPLLGAVPESTALSRSAHASQGTSLALPHAESEAFSLIRAHLRFFDVDRDVRTIVIASPAPGDGKTTVARQLAEAAARLGSRVLLLETDLRHPTLAQQFGIAPGPGLADVLIGAVSMWDATTTVNLDAAQGEGVKGRTLDVLSAGAVSPPNPGELIQSRAAEGLLERAKAQYDLVVVDTPPLTAVSDAFPLLTKVDGVVIVGWVGRSRRDAAERLHQVLASSGAPLLGVVANGSKSNGPGSYADPGRGRPSPSMPPAGSSSELVSGARS